MNLLPLAQKLEDDGVGVQGRTVFINMMPAECVKGILLRNKLSGTKIDYELPGYYKTKFQLIARAQSYQVGSDLIDAAFESLTMANTKLDAMGVFFIRPSTQAVTFPLSKGNLIEFAADFDAVFTV